VKTKKITWLLGILVLLKSVYLFGAGIDNIDAKGNYYSVKDGGFYISKARLSYNAVLYGEFNQNIFVGELPKFWLHRHWIALDCGLPGREEEMRQRFGIEGRNGADAKFGKLLLGISEGDKSKWLHEFENISTTFIPGRVLYSLQDNLFPGIKVILEVMPSAKDKGYLFRGAEKDF